MNENDLEKRLYSCSQCKKEILFDSSIVFKFEGSRYAFCSRKCWKDWLEFMNNGLQ